MAKHLTIEERDRIAQLLCRGSSQNEIARALGRDKGTISRERRRNRTGGEYHSGQAQLKSEQRRRERPIVRKMDYPELNQAVRRKRSPWRLVIFVGEVGGEAFLSGAAKLTMGALLGLAVRTFLLPEGVDLSRIGRTPIPG